METNIERRRMPTAQEVSLSNSSQMAEFSTQTLDSYRLCHSHLRYRSPESCAVTPFCNYETSSQLVASITNKQINNNPMLKLTGHQSLGLQPKGFREEKAKFPTIGKNDSLKTSPPELFSQSELQQKLIILPKLYNSPEASLIPPESDRKQTINQSSKDHTVKRNPSAVKKRESSMRKQKKFRMEFSGISYASPSEGQSRNNSGHSSPTTDANGPVSSSIIKKKQRILTEGTINDGTQTEGPHRRPTQVSLVKAFAKNQSIFDGSYEKDRIPEMRKRHVQNQSVAKPHYNRSKRFITDHSDPGNHQMIEEKEFHQKKLKKESKKLQSKKEALLHRSQTNPIVSSVSLFNKIQSTLSKRQQPSVRIVPKNRNDISFFNCGRQNPIQRIKQLENRLKKLDNKNHAHIKSNVTSTTVAGQSQKKIKRNPSWRHVTINNSARHLIIQQSSFRDQVDRLQSYINKNSELIQKYIMNRQNLLQSVLNTQISQPLYNAPS